MTLRKKVTIIVVASIAVLVLGMGAYVYAYRGVFFGGDSGSVKKVIPSIAKGIDFAKPSTVTTAAQAVYNQAGDKKSAVLIFDTAIQNNTDKNTIASLYTSKGLFLLNTDDFAAALDAAKLAEALNPTYETAMVLAEAYAGTGDKPNAITEYKVAIERAKKLTPTLPAGAKEKAVNKPGNNVDLVSPETYIVEGYQARLKELQK